ncbi:TonB-dependent receptor [Hymenobacter sp. BT770]|uniref:TonB-dependent receptor n=1 Tax=Hymenobacter sp. BT770 TaxID=2886942 RepID=UPI001D124540|nr:TonB-dependent receptor [Hymenobacter sp. BT770]MCC3152775.1 TonB-dependent receptor [Hymenobacter sp. BT770]MDO3414850.1 TonB-dependent receptor [Hymenobacter sp. BT770]
MKFQFLLALLLSSASAAVAQSPLRVLVRDERTHTPLPGVTVAVPSLHTGAATDAAGQVTLPNLPAGVVTVQFSSLGYDSATRTFTLPQPTDAPALVELEPNSLELQGVVVEATRTNSRIEDVPVRIDVIDEEEVHEEASMRPANIAMLLTEATGVQPQFTSANAGSMAFRIQGLDGRYTQILKDGFPLFGGFSQGLSLVQIPPLDLRQVEIIKGASSALYGGDAIAGLVNLVSKTPTEKPELNVLLNQTSKGGRDLTAFYTGRSSRLGLTLLATHNTQEARDVSGDSFSDLPQVQATTVTPRLYYYATDSTTLSAGLTGTVETRAGGYLPALDNPATPGYTERNRSERYNTQLRLDSHMGRRRLLTLKNSVSSFTRRLQAGDTYFAGHQLSTYTEASFLLPAGRHRAVAGANLLTDDFRETSAPAPGARDYTYQTVGLFLQDDWKLRDDLTLQAGLRADSQRPYGLFVLPRVSALYKPAPWLSVRAGGGFGYKAPTVFSSSTEQRAYVNVRPLDPARLQAETSRGLNADFTLRGRLDELNVSFNQAFFLTELSHSLIADPAQFAQGITDFVNAPTPVRARGLETNLRLSVDEFQFLAAYTLTDTRQTYDPAQPAELPFVSRHRLVLTTTYEEEQNFRVALEAFYNGPQYLGEGPRQGRGFWICGALAEKIFAPHFSVVLNVENLLDVRQTRFEHVVTGPITQPTFRPLYAPLDGFVGNAALKFTL